MPRITGDELNRKWGVGALHARYRKDGKWYHTLERFPGALFDEHGFILFRTQHEYESCPNLLRHKAEGKNWLLARHGIASIDGYRTYEAQIFAAHSELPGAHDPTAELWEGGKTTVLVNRYEREPAAREACIAIYGAACSVCSFDFEKVYGVIGQGYIHVHHLRPLSAHGINHRVNPKEDLRPVCPNCHEMLHSKDPPYTIEELRNLMRWHADGCVAPRGKELLR